MGSMMRDRTRLTRHEGRARPEIEEIMCKSKFSIDEIEPETRRKRLDLGGVALLLLILWVGVSAVVLSVFGG